MALVPDKNKIEFLVSRRFRGISLAPAPFLSERYVQSASFSDERNLRKQSSVRETTEAYRTNLQAKTPDEVTALYEAELAKLEAERVKERTEQQAKAEKQESERFFNLQSATMDTRHWSKAAYWSLDEATALSFGRAPEVVKWDNVKAHTRMSPFARQYGQLRDLLLRAQGVQQLYDPVLPGFYIAWAKRNDIAFPPELEAALVARGVQVADWKSNYDDLKRNYDEALQYLEQVNKRIREDQGILATLRRRVAELEATLNVAPPPERGLPGKERESVLRMIIAMAVKGYGFDPSSSRSNVVSEITSDLAQVGLLLSDDNVRKWLKEAAELLPPPETK
jgi:hypothetical protein